MRFASQEFQQTHSRVLAEIEALEAAEREALGSTNIHGSQLLPVSTHADRKYVADRQVRRGSGNGRTDASVLFMPYNNITVEAVDGDDGMEVQVVAGDVDPATEISSVEELDGYGLGESAQGLVAGHVISSSSACDAQHKLQGLSQEEPTERSNFPDSGSARGPGGSEVWGVSEIGIGFPSNSCAICCLITNCR